MITGGVVGPLVFPSINTCNIRNVTWGGFKCTPNASLIKRNKPFDQM